jgi:hypothetical protein
VIAGPALDEPLYRLNAQRIAREIEATPATPAAVGLLEKLARDKTPIPTAALATAGSAPTPWWEPAGSPANPMQLPGGLREAGAVAIERCDAPPGRGRASASG